MSKQSQLSNTQLSVLVCTYNRPELLGQCLSSLTSQKTSHKYRIIVVENSSADKSADVVAGYRKKYQFIDYVKEPIIGLSSARNRGLKEARTPYIAYIDDDAVADPYWVENIYHFISRYPQIKAFGGPYDYFCPVPVPGWYPLETSRYSLGKEQKIIDLGKEWINGTNMIFNRIFIAEIGGFSSMLGMAGTRLGYGEEMDLLLRISNYGEKIYYCPDIMVNHRLDPNKLSLSWLLKKQFYLDFSGVYQLNKSKPFLYQFYLLILSLITLLLRFMSSPKNNIKSRIYYSLSETFSHLGAVAAQTGKMGEHLKYILFKLLKQLARNDTSTAKVIIEAGYQKQPGFKSTDVDTLNICRDSDWKKFFSPSSLTHILAEHVLEHLPDSELAAALTNCYRYLSPGGRLRIAVPDRNRRDKNYIREVAPPKDGHLQYFNYHDLGKILNHAGFKKIDLLEYFDDRGRFIHRPWDDRDGLVHRSFKHDRQKNFKRGTLYYTSLIVDAMKLPDMTIGVSSPHCFVGSEIPPKQKLHRIHPRAYARGFLRRGIK